MTWGRRKNGQPYKKLINKYQRTVYGTGMVGDISNRALHDKKLDKNRSIETWDDKGRAIGRERWKRFKSVGANMMPPTGSEPNCPNCRAGWLLGTPPRCSNCNFGWKKKTR